MNEKRRVPSARKPRMTRLEHAARLILDETENLYYSTPRATLNRLEAIARELLAIEDRL